jgi:hypothetical protein
MDGTDPLFRTIEHWPAEVNQGDLLDGPQLQESQCKISSAATDIEYSFDVWRRRHGGIGDPIKRRGRVDRCRLPGFKVREPFDVVVESLTYFFHGRFHGIIFPIVAGVR